MLKPWKELIVPQSSCIIPLSLEPVQLAKWISPVTLKVSTRYPSQAPWSMDGIGQIEKLWKSMGDKKWLDENNL
jgi:hypothetical protein